VQANFKHWDNWFGGVASCLLLLYVVRSPANNDLNQ
jgi:hypothetical protein